MPVTKFRSVDDIPPPPRGDIRDPEYRAAVRSLLALTLALAPPLTQRGVRRFRSVEEAALARSAEEREAARARAHRS